MNVKIGTQTIKVIPMFTNVGFVYGAAKNSVILIEPQDGNILIPSKFKFRTLIKWSFQILKNHIKKFIGKKAYYSYGTYEDVGN